MNEEEGTWDRLVTDNHYEIVHTLMDDALMSDTAALLAVHALLRVSRGMRALLLGRRLAAVTTLRQHRLVICAGGGDGFWTLVDAAAALGRAPLFDWLLGERIYGAHPLTPWRVIDALQLAIAAGHYVFARDQWPAWGGNSVECDARIVAHVTRYALAALPWCESAIIDAPPFQAAGGDAAIVPWIRSSLLMADPCFLTVWPHAGLCWLRDHGILTEVFAAPLLTTVDELDVALAVFSEAALLPLLAADDYFKVPTRHGPMGFNTGFWQLSPCAHIEFFIHAITATPLGAMVPMKTCEYMLQTVILGEMQGGTWPNATDIIRWFDALSTVQDGALVRYAPYAFTQLLATLRYRYGLADDTAVWALPLAARVHATLESGGR